jgi:deazaflavin-dependent oxidoreductase (nitroreductase family)
MSTYSQPVPVPPVPVLPVPAVPVPPVPVRPSLLVRVAMRPMTRVLNPLIRKFAGRRHFRMAAEIRHVGRKSGRAYVTPAGARVSGDVAVIPLTFGNQSDWSKNVRAAGGCSIRVDGQDYAATEPEFVDRAGAGPLLRSAFGPMERAGFRLLGIKQYLRLQVRPERSGR